MSRDSALVHNPLLRLPSASRIQELPPEAREALYALALDFRTDAAVKADQAWKRNKGIVAAYWKALSVYSLHLARLCRREPAKLRRAA